MRQYTPKISETATCKCHLLLLFCSIVAMHISCKKLIEVDIPVTSTNERNIYSNDATAAAVLTGIYAQISDMNSDLGRGGLTSVSLYPGLSADELSLYDLNVQRYSPYYKNDLTSLIETEVFWNTIYPVIFIANSAIAGLESAAGLTPSLRKQLLGEAKFIRAFSYFYLVNLYGNVPLVIVTDYKTTATLPRSSQSQIYEQIIVDLKDAENLLSNSYVKADAISIYNISSAERVRPTKWAATALLSRVYLFTKDYLNAETAASAVINHSSFYNLPALNDVFLKNSTEAIWQLQPVGAGTASNTGEGALFILPNMGPNSNEYPVYLSNHVVNSFETGDNRKNNWTDSIVANGITYYYPNKYKIGKMEAPTAEYIMVLRLAEQYLIRAEARAQQGNYSGAASDLNVIRARAGLQKTTAATKSDLLFAILHERKVELFTEWGHRWLDLKRTNIIDAVMSIVTPLKGGAWSPYKGLYPIPQNEINRNMNLQQNPGY